MNTTTRQEQSALCRQILGDIQAAGPWRMPVETSSFNDDDVYIYDAATKELVRDVSCKSPEVAFARFKGFAVSEGQSWARGMSAKRLGLWRAA